MQDVLYYDDTYASSSCDQEKSKYAAPMLCSVHAARLETLAAYIPGLKSLFANRRCTLAPCCRAPQLKQSRKDDIHYDHFFAVMPSGGLVSTGPLLTSSQFVLSAVPLLSV